MLTDIEQELTSREHSGMNEISCQPQHHEDKPPVPTATALMLPNTQTKLLLWSATQNSQL